MFLLWFAGLCFGQAPDTILADGLRLLEEGRTTLEEKSLSDAKNYFSRLVLSDANPAYYYQMARVDFYLVESYVIHRENKRAEQALEQAIAAVQHSISLNDRSGSAHSLLADLYGRKIGLGGFLAGPRYGPKIDAENKRALGLEPNNPRVYASLGRQYLYAPRMFGGNLEKAIEDFRKATQLDPSSDENFVWLAIACRKYGDTAAAEKALQQAVRLNPRSAFAKATLEGR